MVLRYTTAVQNYNHQHMFVKQRSINENATCPFPLIELLDMCNAFLIDFCSAHGYFRGLFAWVFFGAVRTHRLQQ